MTGLLLLERLSGSDLAILARAAREPGSVGDAVARLRSEPQRMDALLSRREVFDALFGRGDGILPVAPFLAFAVLIARTRQMLVEASFLREWAGPRRRVPLFDVDPLREFLGEPLRRVFLADLLSSYTRVASGSTWTRTERGWRRRRFSELDPLPFLELLREAPEHQRVLLYRRLADVTLFLTGVFPDFVSARLLGRSSIGRLRVALGREDSAIAGRWGSGSDDPLALLEALGRRCYRLAWEATEPRDVGLARVLGELPERFSHARRILNLVTERFLFPERERWFPLGA